jgi:hypothetical protein
VIPNPEGIPEMLISNSGRHNNKAQFSKGKRRFGNKPKLSGNR